MSSYHFTGNLFVDAGIAGMCAVAGVSNPAELNDELVESAVSRLITIFTSPQALEPRPKPGDPKTTSAFATGELSAIFPNGPHANPANKGSKKAELYKQQLRRLLKPASCEESSSICFCCGNQASVIAVKMDFPLFDSRHNFHPSLSSGHAICSKCALAVQFLPISTLRTSVGGLFWFISSLDSTISVTTAQLTLEIMNDSLARNDRIRFYGDWPMPGRANSIVAAVEFLTRENEVRGVATTNLPINAVFFSNDNRGGNIDVVNIPNSLFAFFRKLRIVGRLYYEKFLNEVLHKPKLSESVAQRMLKQEPIHRLCTVENDDESQPIKLLGGWTAHKYYLEVVMQADKNYIAVIESVANRIAAQEESVQILKSLKIERDPITWFTAAIRKGLITKQEFYLLAPPNDYDKGRAALDYITAATADAVRCKVEGETFDCWGAPTPVSTDDLHPIIQLVEETGARICGTNVGKYRYDPHRLVDDLISKKARHISTLRWIWLRTVQAGVIPWRMFVELVPPNEWAKAFMTRDYMLAYLYDYLHNSDHSINTNPEELNILESAISEEERMEI